MRARGAVEALLGDCARRWPGEWIAAGMSCPPQLAWETGGRPEFGVCAAADVHYLRTGGARAAAVLAVDAAFAHVLAERTAVVPR